MPYLFIICAVLALLITPARVSGAPRISPEDRQLLEAIIEYDRRTQGGDAYKSPDSGHLGWNASGTLAMFYRMYRVTGDPHWLDRIAEQAEVIFANARRDRRGHFGWFTRYYSLALARAKSDPANRSDAKLSPAEVRLSDKSRVEKVDGRRYWVTILGDGSIEIRDEAADRVTNVLPKGARTLTASEFEFEIEGIPQPGDRFIIETIAPEAIDYIVHEGMFLWPIAEFIAIVRADEGLRERYGTRAARYLQLIEQAVLPSWEDLWQDFENGGGAYLSPSLPTMRYPGMTLPHNQYLAMGMVFLTLYRTTGKRIYLDRATAMARFFRSHLRTADGGFVWDYWNPARPEDAGGMPMKHPEDASHASIDVRFAVAAYEMGIVFTQEDLRRMAVTYLRRIWNGSKDNPVYRFRMEGDGGQREGLYLYGWQMLARHCPEVVPAIEAAYRRYPERISPQVASEWLYARYAKPNH